MRRRRVGLIGVAGAALSLGIAFAPAAHASTIIADGCTPSPPAPWLAACGTVTDSGGSGAVTSAGSPAGGAAIGGSGSSSGATVYGDGSDSNQGPAGGWAQVQVSPSGPEVSCGSTGSPGSSSTCP